MILNDLVEKIGRADENGFVRPDYGGLCFSGIPGTVNEAFGIRTGGRGLPKESVPAMAAGGRYDKVVLLLADGFGYDAWLRNSQDGGAIGALSRAGSVAPITAVFPSTTAAALSTLSTGLTPQEHGLFEWLLYMEEIDATIETLPFRLVGTRGRDTMLEKGADPKILLDAETIYERLGREGIESHTLLDQGIARSVYSGLVNRGSTTTGYMGMIGMAETLLRTIESAKGSTMIYAYYGGYDDAAHDQGPDSGLAMSELTKLSVVLKRFLFDRLSPKAADGTLFILASDHGQIPIDPSRTTYLDDDRRLTGVLRKGKDGETIPPVGGPRDLFLHVGRDHVDETVDHFARSLGDKAIAMTTEEARKKGMFGTGEASKRFVQRAGTVLMLPKGDETVWYQHVPGRRMEFRGIHGGLSKREMLVPLVVAEMKALAKG